ncbi:MAG: tetratricopeptide repeat protein [Chlorobiaceae bacterium]|nr:tetratricopeptide repeat protein [Chlorobiaceae bacterium]
MFDDVSLGTAFGEALSRHHQGRLEDARALYDKMLASNGDDAGALHMAGVLAVQQLRYEDARNLMSRALAVDPRNVSILNNLGYVYRELGQPEAAVTCYEKAMLLTKRDADVWYNCGLAYHDLRLFDDAAHCYGESTNLRPEFEQAWNNHAVALKELHRYPEALASCDRAIGLNAANASAWSNRAAILNAIGEHEAAERSCDRGLGVDPEFVPGWSNLAHALKCQARYAEALECAEKVLVLDPVSIDGFIVKGAALLGLRRFEEATSCYETALALQPDRTEIPVHLATAYLGLNRFDEGFACCERAIAADPGNAEAWNNRGLLLYSQCRFDDALECFTRASDLKPEMPEAYWNKGCLQLLLGDFREGWKHYEWRWGTERVRSRRRLFPQPLWSGKAALDGKTILLHSEQGFGDAIQFCRYAGMVAGRGARVLLQLQDELAGLSVRFKGIEVLPESLRQLPEFDFHCPLMSLPLVFGTEPDTIPAFAGGYLKAGESKVQKWKNRLGKSNRLRIGLVWSGSVTHPNDRNRSISLSEMLGMLPEGFEYISLQQEVREEDLPTLLAHPEVRHFGNELMSFEETAALCEVMDLVISVDTSVAHLAGAIGRQVWVLLPYLPDWRWMLERNDTPWYPTMKLFRQTESGNWFQPLTEVRESLSTKLS